MCRNPVPLPFSPKELLVRFATDGIPSFHRVTAR
jgi:hypothetical protein